MKSIALVLALACAMMAVRGAPAPEPRPDPAPADDNRPEILEIIAPAGNTNAQETLATLNLGAPGSELSERNKRTIGILRQLFPSLTQIIEQKVQQITSFVLQTFGPVLLRSFLGNRSGGGAAGGGATGGGGGTVELDDDDDDEDDEPVTPATTSTTTTTTTTSEPAKEDEETEEDSEKRRRKRALFLLPTALADENGLLSGAESQQAEVRVAFGEGGAPGAVAAAGGAQDQQVAASEDQAAAAAQNSPSIDDINLDDIDNNEENRDKRFLSFGANGGSGGSGGGSGNFLFDIVRQAPGAVARAAGTAFRLFAGTDSLNVGLTASHSASLDPNDPQLVAGSSSGSSSGGEATDGDDGAGTGKGDNLTEGVPGPITRLFIIANRGVANLIQDLILRIAQTSERIVNFKARLITSII